jgi:hypothetical protein
MSIFRRNNSHSTEREMGSSDRAKRIMEWMKRNKNSFREKNVPPVVDSSHWITRGCGDCDYCGRSNTSGSESSCSEYFRGRISHESISAIYIFSERSPDDTPISATSD